MSSKPELPSVFQLREEVNAHRIVWAGRSSPMMDMLRAQHAALKEPWCEDCAEGGFSHLCLACKGTGLNPYARSVLEVGEAAGMDEEKETP